MSLLYNRVFPLAQTVKNVPATQETGVWSLGQQDPLEKGMALHSSILTLENLMDRGAWQATVHGIAKGWIQLSEQHYYYYYCIIL